MSDVSPHDLEDTYLPAFRRAITAGKADSIMCAYNAIDGLPACDSPLLLQDHLRSAWGFQGYVCSDCDAVGDIVSGHKAAPDAAHGSADAVRAGTVSTAAKPTRHSAMPSNKACFRRRIWIQQ